MLQHLRMWLPVCASEAWFVLIVVYLLLIPHFIFLTPSKAVPVQYVLEVLSHCILGAAIEL